MKQWHIPLVLLLALTACAPRPAEPPADASVAGPDLEGLMERARLPGLAVAVIEDGRVASVEYLGVADAATEKPVTGETLFEAASLSKPVFATAVLRMAERGELDLDRPLPDYLAYERLSHDPRSELLTARLVLSHRTGLPNWGPERLEFDSEPGGWFGYSGEGYVYLQRAVERETGLTLDELVRREVFAPLGMSRSRFSWGRDEGDDGEEAGGEAPPRAVPHDAAGQPHEKRVPREGNAAASLHTTAEEFARFVVAWMGDDLLDAATIDDALTPVTRLEPAEEDAAGQEGSFQPVERIAWGLGWGIRLPREGGEGHPVYWHWGDNGPAKAFVAFDRVSGDGLVYFANSANGLAIASPLTAAWVDDMRGTLGWLGYELVDEPGFSERLDGFIAESEGRYAEALGAFRAAAVADPDDEPTARRVEWLTDYLDVRQRPIDLADEMLASYAGTYGPRNIVFEDGVLHYERDGGTRYRLIPLSETLFALEGLLGFRLEVVLDAQGRPVKLVGHYVEGHTDESLR